jgi:hypothetical protein
LIHFNTKSYLKSNNNHILKHPMRQQRLKASYLKCFCIFRRSGKAYKLNVSSVSIPMETFSSLVSMFRLHISKRMQTETLLRKVTLDGTITSKFMKNLRSQPTCDHQKMKCCNSFIFGYPKQHFFSLSSSAV